MLTSVHVLVEVQCSEQTEKLFSIAPKRVPPFLGLKDGYFSTRFSKELHCSEQMGRF